MKAEEKRLLHFLEGADKNFIIPVYQRNYDWKNHQCKQLFDDLVEIVNQNFRTHFLGTIVAYNDDGYGKELLIIDGQQRLTTLSILLLAVYKILETGEVESNYILKEKVYDEYLINKYSKDKTKKIRLKPIKDDREAFESIFEGDKHINSNIVVNYEYFINRIKNNEISLDDLYRAIEHLVVVEILLKKGEDDPQLIFESLNSTGLDLSEADKVRNFILMKQSAERQEELYNNYWSKIEKNTNFKVSDFIRDYLTLKERKIPNLGKVYLVFKEYVLKNDIDIEEVLKDLLKFSIFYSKIINSTDANKESSKVLKRLNKLEVIVMYPYLLELFDDRENGLFNEDDFIKILLILESYIFRRFICDVPTNALNKIFMILGKEIKNFPDYKENYFDIFKYILLNKEGSQKFPNDDDFKNYLLIKDIYSVQSKNRLHLLERLENNNNRESDIENLIEEGTLTIEHVMPQTLTPEWEKELGENYNEVHQRYLHTLGNITLTGYNSKYSNKSFQEKKSIEHGFNESPLFLNSFIKNCNNWTEKEIKERYDLLKDKSIKTWSYPETKYQVQKDTTKFFTLDEDKPFTGEKIDSFTIFGNNYKVKFWAEMYEIVIKKLYETDPIGLKKLVNEDYYYKRLNKEISGNMNDLERLSTMLFNNPIKNDLYKTIKVSDDFYIMTSLSTNSILFTLKAIFKYLNIELSDLEFYIK